MKKELLEKMKKELLENYRQFAKKMTGKFKNESQM